MFDYLDYDGQPVVVFEHLLPVDYGDDNDPKHNEPEEGRAPLVEAMWEAVPKLVVRPGVPPSYTE